MIKYCLIAPLAFGASLAVDIPTPEPASLAIATTGGLSLLAWKRKRI